MAIFDLKTDSNNDLVETNGDFSFVESDNKLIATTVVSGKGEFKEFPLHGIGISQYLNSSINPQSLKRIIQTGLKSDGYNNVVIDLSGYPSVISIDENIINFGESI